MILEREVALLFYSSLETALWGRDAQEMLRLPLQLHLSWEPNFAPGSPGLFAGSLVTWFTGQALTKNIHSPVASVEGQLC